MTSETAKRTIGYVGLAGVALHWLCEHPQIADRLGMLTGGPGNDLLAACLIGMILVPIFSLPSSRGEIGDFDSTHPGHPGHPVKGQDGHAH